MPGRARDVGAVRAARVAAAPLVGVGDRRRAGPRAAVDGQRLAVAGRCRRSSAATVLAGARPGRRRPVCAGGRRRRRRRRSSRSRRRGCVLPTSAAVSVYVGAGRAGDVGAVRAGRVAAAPLVRVGDRRRAGPGAVVGGQRLRRRASCPEIVGGAVLTGGVGGDHGRSGSRWPSLDPAAFVAVTTTRIVEPTSAALERVGLRRWRPRCRRSSRRWRRSGATGRCR